MTQKVEKVHNFLDDLEFGKNSKFDDPTHLGPNLGKILNWKKHKLKTLNPLLRGGGLRGPPLAESAIAPKRINISI